MAIIEPLIGRGVLGAEGVLLGQALSQLAVSGQIGELTPPTRVAVFLLGGTVLVVCVLVFGLIVKSAFERLRDRRRLALEASVRRSFYTRLVDDDPDWEVYVDDLSPIERRILIDHVVQATNLVTGSIESRLRGVAAVLGLREEALAAIESSARHDRLWGMKLCIEFGWTPDPERLLGAISKARDEGEAAIRMLAANSNRITRVTGVEIACQYSALSVYGMTALHELLRRDPEPLLEQLARGDLETPALVAQLLRVLANSDPVTDGAPLEGVLACLDHDDAIVRANACLVLARYGWRNDVRDRTDLRLSQLLEDPSTRVRISAYHMLGAWGDTAALAKLDRAAESERNSRAQFAIDQARHGEGSLDDDRMAVEGEARVAQRAGFVAAGQTGWMTPQ